MKHHRRHQSRSPSDGEEYRKRKQHKRHHSQSPSEESENRKKYKHHHEKERHRNYSDGEDDERDNQRQRRNHSRYHREKAYDPNMSIKQEKDDDNFRQQQRERSEHDSQRRDRRRERDREGGDHGLNAKADVKLEDGRENEKKEEKQKPNFELSGKLTEDTNTFRGVVIKYNEPPEAMKPKRRWRLYPFKGDEGLPVLHIHRQSAFLLGRDRRIADIPIDHPSCSKQQAVLQFRAMPYTRPDGTPGRRVRPYIIDLESANGTYVNGEKIEPRRYFELREKDVIKFGFSTREYVVLHDSVDLSEVKDGEDMEEA